MPIEKKPQLLHIFAIFYASTAKLCEVLFAKLATHRFRDCNLRRGSSARLSSFLKVDTKCCVYKAGHYRTPFARRCIRTAVAANARPMLQWTSLFRTSRYRVMDIETKSKIDSLLRITVASVSSFVAFFYQLVDLWSRPWPFKSISSATSQRSVSSPQKNSDHSISYH